ncbi:MAG: hypothetical protein WBV98_04965, partial [Candidatus Sulfotelmatobacter sp.]
MMLDTQAQFMLADFQQRLDSPHLLRVHAIIAMSCVAVTKVMLVTVCLKRESRPKQRIGAGHRIEVVKNYGNDQICCESEP